MCSSDLWYNFVYEWNNAIYLRIFLNKKWLNKIDLKINNEMVNELKIILNKYINEQKSTNLKFSEKIINLLKI